MRALNIHLINKILNVFVYKIEETVIKSYTKMNMLKLKNTKQTRNKCLKILFKDMKFRID